MNIKTTLATVLTAIVIATSATAAVNVTFENPENFSDVSNKSYASTKDRNNILEDLEEYMIQEIGNKIGDQLVANITVTNVDLAGGFEPWRVRLSDVRIVKSTYPARIAIDFNITDLEGNIVSSGDKSLININNSVPVSLSNEDNPFVKELVNRFASSLKI